MRNGNGNAESRRFGIPRHVAVERGLAEFRAVRPILVSAGEEASVAVPVDGLDDDRLAAFKVLSGPNTPRLAITAQRARTLGFDTDEPVLLNLPADADAAAIFALAADIDAECAVASTRADAAATAALDLAKLAQRLPAVLVADAVGAVTSALPFPLVTLEAESVGQFRQAAIQTLKISGEARVPLHGNGETRFVVFRDAIGGGSVAIIVGEPDFAKPVAVRLHSACLTGDVFGSRRCDCGDQLKLALKELSSGRGGIILYLDQEGRGLGLANKMRAYDLQDIGLDTVDANTALGFEDDERDYGVAARMLELLGVRRIELLTNNPAKLEGLTEAGVDVVKRRPLVAPVNRDNRRYLAAKATRAGHSFDHLMDVLVADEQDEKPSEVTS